MCLHERSRMPDDGTQRAWFKHEGAERAWRWWGIHVEEPRGTRIRVRPQAAFDPDSPIEGSDAPNSIRNPLLALCPSSEVPTFKQKRRRMHEKWAELGIRISRIVANTQHLVRAERFDK